MTSSSTHQRLKLIVPRPHTHMQIPVQITTKYECGDDDSITHDVTMTSSGQMTSTAADVRVDFGPGYPVYPDPSVPQANSTCASNPMCAFMGFTTGNCCPSANGVYNACE